MKQTSLTDGSIAKGILYFTIPLFFSNLFQQLYNTIDTIVVGHYLGDTSLAAMGATAALFELIVGFSNGCTNGFSIITAHHYGSKDEFKLKQSVALSIVLGSIISIILTILAYAGMPFLLTILNTPANIYDEALQYIQCISAFLIITMFYNLSSAMLRAIGDSISPLIVLFISSIINIFLDIFCVTTLNMGVFGAAVATVIAQFISTIVCFILIFKKARLLIPSKEHFHFEKEDVKDMLGQGMSMGFMMSIVSIGTVILQSSINELGTKIITGHTAARKVFGLLNIPLSALGMAIATFVSQNNGARQYDHIRKGIRVSILASFVFSIIITIFILLTSKTFITMICGSNDPVVLNNGSRYLIINIPFFIVLGVLLIMRNSIQGLGYKITPLFSSIIELVGKIIFTLIFVPRFHYLGVCWCEPVIWCCMTLQLVISYLKITKKFQY